MKSEKGLYEYLDKSGVLENGSRQAIDKVKSEYWRQYRKEWRKRQRQVCKSYTVFLTKAELKEISAVAANRKMNITQFIKTSTIESARNVVYIDKRVVGQIREFFFETYSRIESMNPPKQVLERFTELERKLLTLVSSLQPGSNDN